VSVTGPAPTRRQLLAGGVGVAAAALSGAATAEASTPTTEFAAMRVGRLLSVELLMLFTYDHVLVSRILTPRQRQVLAPLRDQDAAHVHALQLRMAALGGVGPQPPASVADADRDLSRRSVRGRLGQLQGATDALRLLLAVERVVVGAYFVALTKLQDPSTITLSAQMMANDAQHEAIIGGLLYSGDAQKAIPYALVQGTQ
jgi:hypothetical protein